MSSAVKDRTSRQQFIDEKRQFFTDRKAQGFRTLVTYVKDEWGFKKGVVVALSPTQVGWSLVNKVDTEMRTVMPASLPIVQTLAREIQISTDNHEDAETVGLQAQLIKVLEKFAVNTARWTETRIYNWDRYKGLHNAIAGAYENNGDLSHIAIAKAEKGQIADADVIATIERVNEKIAKGFFLPKDQAAQKHA